VPMMAWVYECEKGKERERERRVMR